MEFRLLGPVEVVEDGKVLPQGRRQERLLLALLALSANQLVPAERLVTLLWDDEQPPQPLRTLQVYASRVRKALPRGASLVARDQGYQLEIDPESVDVHRFQHAVRRAEQEPDPAARAACLREALALWRGPALVDVASEEIRQRLCAGLEEERLQTLESRIEADLLVDWNEQLVAELTGLIAEHPLRERLIASLALALYRAGRAAHALDAIRAAKERAAKDLGLDLGRRLQELELAILQGDAQLLEPADPRSGRPRPRQLPAPVSGFVGRVEVADDLAALLTDRPSGSGAPVVVVSAIAGMGGIGKTALAVEVAHRIAGRFPDGQLFLDLRGFGAAPPMAAAEALGILLRSLGLADGDVPGDPAEAATLYRSLVADRRILIVLDNAQDAVVVEQLLPGAGSSAVIVTSRTQFNQLDTARSLLLDALTDEEALTLLRQLAGGARVDREPEAAGAILRACGNLPLAVRVAGARLAARPSWPISHLADRIADHRRRLDQLGLRRNGVRAVFASSLEQLQASDDPEDRQAAWTFARLGIPDSPRIRVVEAGRLLELPEFDAELLLERLVDAQLLGTTSPGVYRLHDLLWAFANEQAEALFDSDDRELALRRLLSLYASVAWRSVAVRNARAVRLDWAVEHWKDETDLTEPTGERTFGWLDEAKPQMLAVAFQGTHVSAATRASALSLAIGLGTYNFSRECWADLISLNRVAERIALEIGDSFAAGLLLQDLSVGLGGVGDADGALGAFESALEHLRRAQVPRAELLALTNFTASLFATGRYEESVVYGKQALDLVEDVAEDALIGGVNLALGRSYESMGALEAARHHFEEALRAAHRTGEQWRLAFILGELGVLDHRAGRLQEAISKLRRCVDIYEGLSQRDDMAASEGELGEALLDNGEPAEAVRYLRNGLNAAVRIGDGERAAVLRERLEQAEAAL
ncbi:DNA-binding SARP family transcriptional activator [Kribbella sp. VKM Ac-2527]|uniref:DNA-binding SARP family transcriptional activator n=1 Tax=Kribbella caucasensis TaxID=2512215 RepID=A0A4R6K2D0_9ACTN|nr:DNA-binding SARP family transcriptional activator [Kribbella sp. VKM Ac-2527]